VDDGFRASTHPAVNFTLSNCQTKEFPLRGRYKHAATTDNQTVFDDGGGSAKEPFLHF
jgi:hypothetical protein